MSFSAKTVRNAIIAILQRNNTTTSSTDVSSSLNTRVVFITSGSFKDPTPSINYPAIRVQADGFSNEFFSVGQSAKKDITSTYTIRAATNYITPDGAQNAEDECIQLTENIDAVLNNYVDLSGTVGYSRLTGVNWSFDQLDATYAHIAEITLEVEDFGK